MTTLSVLYLCGILIALVATTIAILEKEYELALFDLFLILVNLIFFVLSL